MSIDCGFREIDLHRFDYNCTTKFTTMSKGKNVKKETKKKPEKTKKEKRAEKIAKKQIKQKII